MRSGKHRIEIALEKLIKEFTRLIRDFRRMFFTIPKKKIDKMIYVLETGAWVLLTLSLILRIGR